VGKRRGWALSENVAILPQREIPPIYQKEQRGLFDQRETLQMGGRHERAINHEREEGQEGDPEC